MGLADPPDRALHASFPDAAFATDQEEPQGHHVDRDVPDRDPCDRCVSVGRAELPEDRRPAFLSLMAGRHGADRFRRTVVRYVFPQPARDAVAAAGRSRSEEGVESWQRSLIQNTITVTSTIRS